MKHIIDTDELEKLLSAVTIDTFAGEPYVTGLTEIYALIASSPQADGMVLETLIDRVCLKAAEIHNLGKFVSDTDAQNVINEIRAMLSAYKPQADDAPPDVYDIVVDTGDGIYHTAELVHFQQSGSKRMIQVRLGEPKADDVRKDAEREWTENDGNHANSKKVANRMGRIDVKFRSGFVAKDYSPNDFDFSQNGSFYDITAFRPHKF